jgi:hypothetical protein
VADLIEAEVLVESGTKASGAGGRPAVALGLAPRAGSLVGSILDTPTSGWSSRPWTGDIDRARVLAVGVAVSASVVDSRRPASPPMLPDWGVSTSPAFWVSGPGSRSASLADGRPKGAPRTSHLRFGLAASTATTHRETKRCAYVDFHHSG